MAYYAPDAPGHNWVFWQHSDKGKVNGIRASVDFNVFAGTAEELNAYLIGSNSRLVRF